MNPDDALRALRTVSLDPTQDLDSVWRDDPYHVEGMHPRAMERFERLYERAKESPGPSPLGLVILGPKGSGKTHFLGQLRRATANEALFVFGVILNGSDFWRSVAYAYAHSLMYQIGDGTQLRDLLADLGHAFDWPEAVRERLARNEGVDKTEVDRLVMAFRERHGLAAMELKDVLRALLLMASPSLFAQDIAHSYLTSVDLDRTDYLEWGFRSGSLEPRLVVQQLSALIAMVRPQVFAVDQLDDLVHGLTRESQDERSRQNVQQVFSGLMNLRDATRRTVILVSCLAATWEIAKSVTPAAMPDRFQTVDLLKIPSRAIAEAVVRNRLAPAYAKVHFDPPYPTWPIRPEAFEEALEYYPRGLMKLVQRHVDRAVETGEMTELSSFDDVPESSVGTAPKRETGPLEKLDERFRELFGAADVTSALDPSREDTDFPVLLHAGLTALRHEDRASRDLLTVNDPPRAKSPGLHAKLHYEIDHESDRHQIWSFRAIAHTSAIAVLARLRAAATESGIREADPDRHLVLVRNSEWPGRPGAKTQQLLQQIEALNGRTFRIGPEDLATFAALRSILEERPEGWVEWLQARKPASSTAFLQSVFEWAPRRDGGKRGATASIQKPPRTPQTPNAPRPGATAGEAGKAAMMPLGDGRDGTALTVPLEVLRKHVVVFAGSGSGKTVMIRRMIEEAALLGVSSIVLDTNNDLARMADQWPTPPEHWAPGDAELASAYHEGTEVLVFTPRRNAGRPIAFQPLPDFASLQDDADAMAQAIEVAVAALAPRAFADAANAKAVQNRAVLKAALEQFANGRYGSGLDAFIELLRDPPVGLAGLPDSDKHAKAMANLLQAARVNDPLFGGEGTAADPGLLLTPSPGKRARISVISFIGLPDDSQRQGFVNQLQMALFSWAKKHPAGDRPLGGLFVMDEAQNFAPSGKSTPCTESTLSLASQARKYGLGLIFATQAPKGLHNHIPGNSTTQYFGRLSAPAQISGAKELAAAKGGHIDDIGQLEVGQFYVVSEATPMQKVRTRLCLSYHPPSPLTEEEVVERASG